VAVIGEVRRSGDVPQEERVTISRSVGGRLGPKSDMVNRKIGVAVGNRIEIFNLPFRWPGLWRVSCQHQRSWWLQCSSV